MTSLLQGFGRTMAFIMIAALLIGVLQPQALKAQGTTASISGTVMDASGAAVPDAAVQAKNLASGATQSANSDSQGRFRLVDLGIGDYEVQASKAGFQTLVRSGITLTVGSQIVVDLPLTVGQAQQTVTVEGQASQVETQSTAVGALVEQTQMRELPLNGRNFGQLITLAPGVQSVAAGNSFYGKTDNYSISGSRPEGTAFLLDNTNIAGFWNHGTGSGALGSQLGVDAISEFQTLTNTYSAQFGGNGAVINAVTKSGTNAFHGSAYEFLRNSDLDARNFFDPRTIPSFRRNQFGGTVGGPIKKDKAFFFVNYEGLRQNLGETRVSFVPDANAHQGLLPIGPGGSLVNVGVAPNVAATLALYPIPGNSIGGGIGTATSVASQVGNENYFLGRFDYSFSEKDSLFARYVRDTANLVEPFSGANIPLWPEKDITANHYATIEERHIFSPTVINLARVSFVRPEDSAATSGSTPALQYFPGRINGTIQFTGGGVDSIGANQLLPFGLPENKFTIGDDILWTRGAHSLKFGVSGERDYSNTYAPFLWGGQWTFSSLQAFLQGQAGVVVSALPGQDDGYKDFRTNFFTPYIQDDWKVNARLVVNMGLRYEFETNPYEVRHGMTAFINPPFGGFQPVTHAFQTNPSTKNFNPRIGLAYDPFADHKTSIRAGFGLFHDLVLPRLFDPGYWLNPPFALGVQLQPNYPTPFAGNGLLPPQASQYEGTDYYFGTTPYMIQYNFNIQRDLGRGFLLTAGYVGSQGVHLVQSRDRNPELIASGTPTNPVFDVVEANGSVQIPQNGRENSTGAVGSLSEKSPAGHSHYNSLQASLNRRFSSGFQLQASYTYSKSIDNGSVTYGLEGPQQDMTNPYNAGYDVGPSLFSRKQSFNTSFVYALPFHGNQLVNGWRISGIFTAVTGQPLDILDGPGMSGSSGDRPNLVAGASNNPVTGNPNQWLNPASFSLEPLGTLGNLGRDTAIGPGLWNLDTALLKETRVTKISESFSVQFRAEFFNIFNHANFAPPPSLSVFNLNPNGTAAPNPAFGQITSTANNSRQIQFGLKVIF
jgi:hypothetical protein